MKRLPSCERVEGLESAVRKLKGNIIKTIREVFCNAIACYMRLLTSILIQCFPKAEHVFSFSL